MQTVHCDRESLMGFLRDRTIGHSTCLKPCHNRVNTFHFLKRNTFLRIIEVELSSQVDLFSFFIHHLCILFEHIVIAASCGLLEHMDGLRIIEVFLSSALIFVTSHAVKCHITIKSQRIKRLCMECSVVFRDLFNADTAHTAYGISKIPVDKLFFKSDCLENFCPLIGLDRGNSHLGRNLDDPMDHCTIVVIYSRVVIFVEQSGFDQLPDGLVSQIRVDRTGTITQQCCKVVHFSRLAALQDHCNGCSLLRAYQMLLEAGYCQKRRDRHMIFVHVAVCQDQDIGSAADYSVHLYKEILDSFLKACVLIVSDRDLSHLESLHLHILDL